MKTTTLKILSTATLIAATWLGSQTSDGAILIDDFTTVQIAVDANPTAGSSDIDALADAGVLGGSREFIANRTNPQTGTLQVKTSSNEFATEQFIFDQSSSTTRGIGSIVYDGSANGAVNTTGLGAPGEDLTAGGSLTFFVFKQLAVSGSGLILTVSLYDSVGVPSTAVINLVDGFEGDLAIPYATFTNPTTAAAVYGLRVDIDGRAVGARGSDLSFDLISSEVPEPASLGLIGSAGLLALRRRRRA